MRMQFATWHLIENAVSTQNNSFSSLNGGELFKRSQPLQIQVQTQHLSTRRTTVPHCFHHQTIRFHVCLKIQKTHSDQSYSLCGIDRSYTNLPDLNSCCLPCKSPDCQHNTINNADPSTCLGLYACIPCTIIYRTCYEN